ncbi:CoA-acylating methylmalonate-semialdehyde dehydrogenase [Salinisphaera sp. USBA-960]|uniref:CoA-acylating methylmalonate-semialdehyde dehydrogenase n=1 Tax=Salinisphaera orenii TaxID=856731 RepID=UPI000DBE3DFE|nr:CoA-acylating methylmalonate-semialdehyde dehydrogenase [Salifodinibacter halophilus]NNC25667.1 CoA-acylating methylmalonate-semialdehyde dehydrogenase [Salifodinibacter halophilus]
MREILHFINGEATSGQSAERGAVYNPTAGEQQAEIPIGTPDDIDCAVAAAKAAYPGWAATTPLRRARVLFRFKTLLEERRDDMARLLASEHGKVFSDAQGEVTRGIEVVEFACGMPHLQKGENSMNVGTGVDSYSMYQPLGVCAGITPFNFPAMVPMWMYPIAIAAGNTFVLKPADKDPSASMLMAELFKQAGLPDGVFNVVQGRAAAVNHLITHDDVSAVSFVGSTPIAKHIYETASAAEKRVQALGGAKNHMVVMPDADIDGVADALMGAAYGSAGERCMAISVAVPVGEQTADKLREALVKRLENLQVGPSLVDGADNDMGPLVSAEHHARITDYIGIGEAEGAELVVDGRRKDFSQQPNGYFIGGSLFDHTGPGMRVYDEEIFGPVLCMSRADSLDDAIDLINSNEFANGTSIFTESGHAGRMFSERIEVGMVGVNVPIPVPMAFHSFGGWKRSLFGPLHVHGSDGVRFYTRQKTVTARWPKDDVSHGSAFTMPTH